MSKKVERDPMEEFEDAVVRCITAYIDEAALVKRPRLLQNRKNWDSYFMRGDFSNKVEGQSREFLPKNANAVEQVVALVNATLTNFDKWFSVRPAGIEEHPIFTSHVTKELMLLYLEKAQIKVVLSDGVKIGANEGEVTIKRVGELTDTVRFKAKGSKLKKFTKKEWSLSFSALSGEDWFSDPYAMGGKPLYQIHQMSCDYFSLLANAITEENPDGIYELEELEELTAYEDLEIEQRKARNRGEVTYNRRASRRKPILVHQFVGTLLDVDGKVLIHPETGEEMKNVVATLANKSCLIQKPETNPRWDGSSGFVSAPILRTPFAAHSKALADAGEKLNVSLNELFNLMLDGGLSAVFGIKQIHSSWLEDPSQISNGIPPGTTLVLRDDAPGGMSVMERVDSGSLSGDVLALFNIVSGLHTEAMLTNETRLGGLPSKQVKATEIVASNQALSGIFDSITKEFEVALVQPLLQGVWNDILQNIDEFPIEDLVRIAGPERARVIHQMSRQERFAIGFRGFKFIAKGLSSLTERLKDFQRLSQFLSVVGANPSLFQEFNKEYSMTKLLGKLLYSLSIDPDEIKFTDEEIKAKQKMEAVIQGIMQKAQIEGGTKGDGTQTPGRSAELPETEGSQAGPGTEPGATPEGNGAGL